MIARVLYQAETGFGEQKKKINNSTPIQLKYIKKRIRRNDLKKWHPNSKDINGNEIRYEYDPLGRLTKATGPYELRTGGGCSILFEYHPEAQVPWALTRHYDPANPKNNMQTATFADGLGRVLQTKKDGALFKGDGVTDKEVMIVSGRVLYDGLGRATKAWYPVTES